MRKLFVLLVAIFLATSAYALVETENGPQHIIPCWMTGTAACTSGNVVVLQTSSPTYPGKEVTGTTTVGLPIFGVVVESTNYTATDMAGGKWIRVQTCGYCPIVKLDPNAAVTANSSVLVTSDTLFTANSTSEVNYLNAGSRVTGVNTGNTVAFSTVSSNGSNYTCSAILRGL
jgi:hypothetical protein